MKIQTLNALADVELLSPLKNFSECMEYFKIFGFDSPRLDLDLRELEKIFYKLSMQTHPDLNNPHLNNSNTNEKSAELNLAYKTLRDPWVRALYYLGPETLSESKKVPANLANMYFEMQDAEDTITLHCFHNQLIAAKEARLQKLNELFRKIDAEKTPEVEIELKELVLENTYANSMLRDLDSRIEKVSSPEKAS
ncbi:MAG: DnaJ domain-containing protein [Deltaproteobacteria bacterium]|nr:DnaJ domain-containing protein [Deltaproteobacteria bacterium]